MTIQKTSLVLLLTVSSTHTLFASFPVQDIPFITDADTLQMLDDVVVTGSRSATTARNLPMTVSVVGRPSLLEHQRISVLPTLTEQVPGLFVTQRGMIGFGVSNGAAGGINLRGISAGTGQLLVLIDGHPQYNGIYGHSIADAYQTMMTERVEVLRGPASVLYGSNAMGGVINIVTREMQTDGVQNYLHLGTGSWGTVQTEISSQVCQGKFSSTVALQYARTDNHRPRMGFEQYGGYAKVGYDLGKYWHAFVDIDLTHFNASYPGTTDAPMYEADQWITRGTANAGIENRYENTSGRLSVYHNWGRHKINDGFAEGKQPQSRLFRSKDALTGISWYQTANPLPGSNITVGIDYQHIYGDAFYTSRETGEVLETANKQSAKKDMNEVAGYVDLRQELTSWLTLDAGIRYDHHSVVGNEWVPQAGIVVRPLETAEIRLMASKGFRCPTMREMYLYPPSNEELKPERLWNYELAWNQRLPEVGLTYGLNIFLLKGDNMIQTVTVKTPEGGSKKQNINTGEVSNRGIELEASWHINEHWLLHTNQSFLYMKYHVLGAPEYKGYLSGQYRQGRWSVSAGLQQICGLFTAVGTDEDPQETFTLLNATVNYQLSSALQMWFKGDNLLGQQYEINTGYPMPRATFMTGINVKF